MATQFSNQATSTATVAGQTVNFSSNLVTSELFDVNSVTLLKTQSSDLVVIGSTITYTVTITNLTLSPITNFNFLDTIPTGMTYVNSTFKANAVSQTPTVTGQNLSYVFPSLLVGATVITFDCTVN